MDSLSGSRKGVGGVARRIVGGVVGREVGGTLGRSVGKAVEGILEGRVKGASKFPLGGTAEAMVRRAVYETEGGAVDLIFCVIEDDTVILTIKGAVKIAVQWTVCEIMGRAFRWLDFGGKGQDSSRSSCMVNGSTVEGNVGGEVER